MMLTEVQLEGLIGPTHNYAGLSPGNVASATHAGNVSHPKEAALQSLEKMRFVHNLGVPTVVMPPHPRPKLALLNAFGMSVDTAAQQAPELLAAAYSASPMWTANAATVSASCDSGDGRLHLAPANLISHLHRSIETDTTRHYLRQILPEAVIHPPLPAALPYSDEGAANHMRLCGTEETDGITIFTYGIGTDHLPHTARYPARQHLHASQAIARAHGLDPQHCFFWRQSAQAIDAGVFHNDVIAMSHRNLLIVHEDAYDDTHACLSALRHHPLGGELTIRTVTGDELPLAAAVETYFFNAQLVSDTDGRAVILFPRECAEHAQAQRLAQRLLDEMDDIAAIHFFDVRQSMKNGGGPACLRLRIPMRKDELAQVNQAFLFDAALEARLKSWINRYYRDQLSPEDLHNPQFAEEALAAYEALKAIFPI